MRYAVISNGVVENVIIADPDFSIDGKTLVQSDDASPGWLYANGVFTMPAPSPAQILVPEVISDRQFFQALALQGTITQVEALAAVKTGTIPPALRGYLDGLSGADAFAAEMLLSGATEFRRSHPLTIAIGGAQGMTPAQIDAFFQFASTL